MQHNSNVPPAFPNEMTGKQQFKELIYDYYKEHGRSFPWRLSWDPYHILISEIMLQQTQTSRVVDKFQQFITTFPTIQSLAHATLRDVLTAWQGLGYNRRGMNLHKTAQIIVAEHQGIVPNDPKVLINFPGIGPNTAGSIVAFAYNKPTVFIETNIRTVFIHHYFKDLIKVHDKQIIPLIEQTVDVNNPRHWYYALMDYGVMLKKKYKNPSRKSVHHTRQTPFEGSDRQIRSTIVRFLTAQKIMHYDEIISLINKNPDRISRILEDLVKDQLLIVINDFYSIA